MLYDFFILVCSLGIDHAIECVALSGGHIFLFCYCFALWNKMKLGFCQQVIWKIQAWLRIPSFGKSCSWVYDSNYTRLVLLFLDTLKF